MGCDRARGLDCACRRTRTRWSPGERWYNSWTGISPECAMLWCTRSQIQGTERQRDRETERLRKLRSAIVPKAAMRARLLPCVSFKPSCWSRAAGRVSSRRLFLLVSTAVDTPPRYPYESHLRARLLRLLIARPSNLLSLFSPIPLPGPPPTNARMAFHCPFTILPQDSASREGGGKPARCYTQRSSCR